jgi:hypothetical protein
MKHLKVFAPAAAVAIATFTLFGSGTASATVLCKTNANPCPEKYLLGTTVHASIATGTDVRFVDSGGFTLDICKQGQLNGRITSTGSSIETVIFRPEFVEGTPAMSYENCAVPLQIVNLGSYEIHSITGTVNGTLTVTGQTIYFNTGECQYATGTGAHAGTFTGGTTPTIDYSLQLTKTSGTCIWPSARLTATYSVTSPSPIYVEPS